MPAGRLLRLGRPVGRACLRPQSTYTRVGKAVQPQAKREAAKEGSEAKGPEAKESAPLTEDVAPPEPTPTSLGHHRAAETKDASQNASEGKQANEGREDTAGPMEVLYMREPTVIPGKEHPPMPFTHYFDTYLMVNRLTNAGFKKGEAITTMKAIRALLGGKMEEAQGRLVSKGDVDNVGPLRLVPRITYSSSFGHIGCHSSRILAGFRISLLSLLLFMPHTHTIPKPISSRTNKRKKEQPINLLLLS